MSHFIWFDDSGFKIAKIAEEPVYEDSTASMPPPVSLVELDDDLHNQSEDYHQIIMYTL